MTEEKKNNKSTSISIDCNSKMSTRTDDIKNVGYGILKELYKQLELDKFWNWKTRNLSIQYSVDQIFRLLVFSRILNPASKKGTFDRKDFYFDCTNYYFDIGRSDIGTAYGPQWHPAGI